ncbi:MAG: FAD-dependent oxidoreductase, partial [Deferrisomatales bacterium]
MNAPDRLTADVLVIGGGLAGLSAALQARKQGAEVLLLCRGRPGRGGNTLLSAANLSAPLGPGDSADRFARDLLAGGRGLGDPALVGALAADARGAVAWLEGCGVGFRRDGPAPALAANPGHAVPRTLSAAAPDRPASTAGLALSRPVLAAAEAAGVRFCPGAAVLGLARDDHGVAGAWGTRSGGPFAASAGAVVLAAGGIARLYRTTNNATDVLGTGAALALEAGAELRDLEFVQFHPTMALRPVRLVVPTTVFADGAVLRNRLGERFLAAEGEAAVTRDRMSRAI